MLALMGLVFGCGELIEDCLGCQKCELGPVVTLWDGRVVCNECPDWRCECEARKLLKIRSMKKIAQELEWRENPHGRDNSQLKRYMRGIYDQKKGKR